MAPNKFHIRDTIADSVEHEAQYLLDAFDAALPHLNATGSGGQWGAEPLSLMEKHREAMAKVVSEAETYGRTKEGSATDLLVAEVDLPEGATLEHTEDRRVKVAALTQRDEWWPDYVSNKADNLKPHIEGVKNWAYVHLLISDFRTGEWRKGAGAALISEAKAKAKARGREALYVDCWAGNGRRLVKFYETQGFILVDDFSIERPGNKLGPFDGALLKMDL